MSLDSFDDIGFHTDLCYQCKKRKDCKSGVLFGGVVPEDCPYVLEHMIGDKDNDLSDE